MKPEYSFYLFGMGWRRKMIFFNNCLFDLFSKELLYCFQGEPGKIIPEEYKVIFSEGEIYEDETGVYLREGEQLSLLSEGYLNIPEFRNYPNQKALKILFHEITINIVDGKPVPNLIVYEKPWYRDAAMMCMVLEHTGNLHLVYEWIQNLDEVYDRNNAGNCEPDNLGQVLYMISLVSDRNHPLVSKIMKEIHKWEKDGYIQGLTDGNKHPVYQTKWLKFGLKKLGLQDIYQIPEKEDDYGNLFWMDFVEKSVEKEYSWEISDYPYLEIAKMHYEGQTAPIMEEIHYPITWERNASQAHYDNNLPYFVKMKDKHLCAPHTWHAAELYLWMVEK